MVHPSADVAPDVRVGRGTQVWHRAQVREGAVLGDECIVGRDAYIDAGVRVGDRVKIQNGALLYAGTVVESGVFIGPGAILTNDRFPRAIMLDGALARSGDWALEGVRLNHGCSVGAGAVIVAGAQIGRFATVGAGAVVTHSVPDHALVVGNPARSIGWVCACGGPLVDAPNGAPEGGPQRVPEGDADGAPGGALEGAGDGSLMWCPRDGSRYEVRDGRCRAWAEVSR